LANATITQSDALIAKGLCIATIETLGQPCTVPGLVEKFEPSARPLAVQAIHSWYMLYTKHVLRNFAHTDQEGFWWVIYNEKHLPFSLGEKTGIFGKLSQNLCPGIGLDKEMLQYTSTLADNVRSEVWARNVTTEDTTLQLQPPIPCLD
jgi:hypothetical protein